MDTAIVDALPIVKRTLGEGIEISLSSRGHLPRVLLAPGELQRILVNLAANSRDAMPEGGSVTIRTGQVTIPPATGSWAWAGTCGSPSPTQVPA